uniref:Carboxypeptidase activation peptide domain-containing protein n=1 Tax=Acrobeloides nanus TaxID=290746 RepID=A0A914CEX9_9BILA
MRLSVFLLGLFATSAFSLVIPQRKSYTGHSVWKVHVGTHDQAKAIQNLETSHGLKLDFWRDVKRVPGSADIRVSPKDKLTLKKFLDSQGIPFQVKIEDVDR